MKTNDYKETLKELWAIRNPHAEFTVKQFEIFATDFRKSLTRQITSAVRLLSKKAVFELTTARNRNLITPDEQARLKQTTVAFYGLSVGSHAALTWMMLSRADSIKIVDPDSVSPTNLNRIRAGFDAIGKKKALLVKNELQRINPDATIFAYDTVNKAKLEATIHAAPEVQAIVDEIDSFEGKVALRKYAKTHKIPLISAADVGDNIVVDIERYDLSPQPEFFLGRLGDVASINFSKLSSLEKKKLIIHLVGFKQNAERMLESLFAIKGSIPTWPQLGSTATISGGVVATILKKIFLGEKVASGRYYISLDDIFVSDFHSSVRQKRRNTLITQLEYVLSRSQ